MRFTEETGTKAIKGRYKPWIDEAITDVLLHVKIHHKVSADEVQWRTPPPHPNCVGVVFKELAKERLLRRKGFKKSTTKLSRGHVLRVWEKV